MASSIITEKNLSPATEDDIHRYELETGKVVPPDFRFWLTNYGYGEITFLNGPSACIQPIEELFTDYGRLKDEDDPANCWKRISLWFGAAPCLLAVDSTVIDEHGCAPVIHSKAYSNHVDEVLASSYFFYIVRLVIEACRKVIEASSEDGLGEKDIATIKRLAETDFLTMDTGLEGARIRVAKHAKTRFVDGDPEPGGSIMGGDIKIFHPRRT